MASIKRRTTSRGERRYDVRYRTPDGRPRVETFRTRREAEHRSNAVEADKGRGAWVDPRESARPFREVAADWLESNPAKREASRARDEGMVRLHLNPTLGDRPVGRITPGDVQGLVHDWSTKVAPATVRRHYSVTRAIFNYAVSADLIVRTPCRGVKLPAETRRARRVVTPDELAALAGGLGLEYGPMAYLGAVLGLRWGEIAGLRVGRLDFLAGRLTVAEQVTRGKGGRIGFGPPKSEAGRRTLAVPRALMDMLAATLAHRGLDGTDADELVFVADGGGPLNPSNWRHRHWLPACDTAGLTGLAFHDLRRAAATSLVLAGIDLKTAQARLGHSTPALTLGVYAQVSEEADRDAADELGARWIGPRDRRAMEPKRRGHQASS